LNFFFCFDSIMNSKIPPVSNSANLAYIEARYAAYVEDPSSVDQDWRAYFAALNGDAEAGQTAPASASTAQRNGAAAQASRAASGATSRASTLQEQVNEMIRAFRSLGHKAASLDPLGLSNDPQPSLDPEFYGLSADDMKRLFPGAGLPWNGPLSIGEIVERLRRTYCGPIGVEFMHIDEPAVRNWLQQRMEESQNRLELGDKVKLRILARLTDAVTFEEFVRKKFVGAKSFSLEGAESLIPLLDLAIDHAARDGLQEIVLAMAHRGRLK
jgi:2-oxoglutarate dehydrogenase E1 component